MDTFIDKLAQKLTAQEMIKANAAADAEELKRIKSQVAQYEAVLQEIREASCANTEAAETIRQTTQEALEQLSNTDKDSAEKVQMLVDASMDKIKKLQVNELELARLGEQMEARLGEQIENIRSSLNPLFTELTGHVHKENVKVYRNVQAVVVEETENTAKTVKSISGKLNAVMGVSVVALLAATAGLVFQILVYLQII
ncbi:MAG: hypothetical protein HDR26_10210 [Lachnospiraceae bacterium]|nr:hypothetical protein [Lachnospiraceae bacterium]